MKRTSYISTTVLPMKIVINAEACWAAMSHRLYPYHVRVMPTNRCNMRCPECTYQNMDRKLSIPYKTLLSTTEKLVALGMRAVTITGGGEPLCYPHTQNYINYLCDAGIGVGMVTNGLGLREAHRPTIDSLEWCRISQGDHVPFYPENFTFLGGYSRVKFGFSYLVGRNIKADNLCAVLRFAEENGFTHVRVVDSVVDDKKEELCSRVEPLISGRAGYGLVVYQPTNHPRPGTGKCLISLLRPVLGPDGCLYPCCGCVYARKNPDYKMTSEFKMGDDIDAIYHKQQYFNGAECARCFEGDANDFLNALWDNDRIANRHHL